MKAIWLENNQLSYRSDVPVPEPTADEALVTVSRAGICGTDLQLLKGYYPFNGIPGHEFAGKIVQAPGQPEREGQRVVGEINMSCGACPSCLAGRKTHCEKRAVLGVKNRNGAFAEYVCLPLVNLIEVPDTVPDDAAVFVEPLAAALEIQAQIPIGPQNNVLVLGAGQLGQLTARSLIPSGCDLSVVARYEKQRNILAKHNIKWLDESNISDSRNDIVIEATGSPDGFLLAQNAVRPRGSIVLKSTYTEDQPLNLSPIVVNEISIIGSRCGPFAPAIQLIESGRVDPTDLIEGRYPLQDAHEAFDQAGRQGTLKIILEIG